MPPRLQNIFPFNLQNYLTFNWPLIMCQELVLPHLIEEETEARGVKQTAHALANGSLSLIPRLSSTKVPDLNHYVILLPQILILYFSGVYQQSQRSYYQVSGTTLNSWGEMWWILKCLASKGSQPRGEESMFICFEEYDKGKYKVLLEKRDQLICLGKVRKGLTQESDIWD